jgi:TonB family protein
MFGEDQSGSRQTLAFSLSLLLHFGFATLIVSQMHRRTAEPPIEISILAASSGAASAPSGEESAEAAPMRAPQRVAKPVERRSERPMRRMKPVERSRPAPTRAPPTQALEGVESSVELHEAPPAGPAANGELTTPARSSGPSERAGGGRGAEAGDTGRGSFSVSGPGVGGAGRSYASIWEWTQRYLAGLRWVYNGELRNNPELHGVMVVRYEILTSGAVGDVTLVSTELGDHRLERGVLGQIREWRYPPEPSGSVVVTWPFSFEPPS